MSKVKHPAASRGLDLQGVSRMHPTAHAGTRQKQSGHNDNSYGRSFLFIYQILAQ
jgi:hypothetical protein